MEISSKWRHFRLNVRRESGEYRQLKPSNQLLTSVQVLKKKISQYDDISVSVADCVL